MRRLSFRPAVTFRGRTFKGLRGWAGKPLHPPLTDIPVGAYMIVAGLDVISQVAQDEEWARDFFRAATFVLIAGASVSLLTALTGFWDWLRSTQPGTQVRREANAHAVTMTTVTVLVLTNIGLRTLAYGGDSHSGAVVVALSIVAAVLTVLGGTIGGSLVYGYGFNVETAGDHPAYHESERDVLPGEEK
ncbi:MAG: DUF2231 domain-containing protein [Acidimicrobiia bacterium]